jgi:hypothetical protein
MIDTLSQIGRRAPTRSDAARVRAGAYDDLTLGFERGEGGAKKFQAWGSAQPLDKAQFGQGESKPFL